MNILYITHCDGCGSAGHGAHIRGVVGSLLEAGHSVAILAQNYPKSADAGLKRIKIPILHLKGFMGISYAMSASVVLIYYALTGRIHKDTLVYFRYFNSSFPLQYIVRRLTAAVILVEFNASIEKEHVIYGRSGMTSRVINRSILRACRFSDGVVAVSEAVRQSLVKNRAVSGDAVQVIENAVDRHIFIPRERDACRSALGIDPDGFMLCYAGALQKYQGLDILCESLKHLRQQMDGVMLYIVGDGKEMDRLKECVESSDMTDVIRLAGWQPSDIVAQYIAASDLCVAPYNRLASAGPDGKTFYGSLLKGSPMKIFAYLSCGRPIIATHFKEAGVLVQELKAGLAVPADNPVALAKAIMYLYERPAERKQMGDNARRYAERYLSWDHVASKIMAFAEHARAKGSPLETGVAAGDRET